MAIEVNRDQVRLLASVLPPIIDKAVLAFKGGMAINVFELDMPRLSIDIDLTNLPTQSIVVICMSKAAEL